MAAAEQLVIPVPVALDYSELLDEERRLKVSWELEWHPLHQLFVDYHEDFMNGESSHYGGALHAYQRKQEKNGRVMAAMGKKGYNPDLFGVLIGTERDDGMIALCDGGTRYRYLMGLVEKGLPRDTLIPVLVNHWDRQREITNYIDLNRERASLSQVDWFVAKIKVGDPKAVEINQILIEESGGGVNHKKGGWQAVAMLQHAHNRGNLRATVTMMRKLGWLELPRGKSQGMIGAMSRLLFKGAEPERIMATWAGQTPNKIYQAAREFIDVGQSRAVAIGVAMYLAKLYNKGLRSRKLDLSDMVTRAEEDGDDEE